MENRRAHYRHPFAGEERIPVEMLPILPPPTVAFGGNIINLSVGGMGVEMPTLSAGANLNDHVRARFSVPRGEQSFAFECTIVHRQDKGDLTTYGVRFQSLADPSAEQAREKTLWKYLLDEQRRAIRARREKRKP